MSRHLTGASPTTRQFGNHVGSAISSLESAVDVADGHRRRAAGMRSTSRISQLRNAIRELTRAERLLPRGQEFGLRTLSDLVAVLEEKAYQAHQGLSQMVTASDNRDAAAQERLRNLRTALNHLGDAERVLSFPEGEGTPLAQLEGELLQTTLEVKGSLQGMVDLLERERDTETVRLESIRKIVERVQSSLHRGGFLSRRLARRTRPR